MTDSSSRRSSQASSQPSDRRAFFRRALGKIVEPLADYLVEHGSSLVERGVSPSGVSNARSSTEFPSGYLRPPGAIPEQAAGEKPGFSDTCLRCGACIDACPADAIFALDRSIEGVGGTPVIDPDRAACVVCDGLQCTHVCPSGALKPLSAASDIKMGLAEVYGAVCLRSAGDDCAVCVDRCPLGEAAIRFSDCGPPEVLAAGCTGCGVCQLHCPTSPKAITVIPR